MFLQPESLKEFKGSNEYAELNDQRKTLLKFYGSSAFKAQQAFLEVAKAACLQGMIAGKTPEVREDARNMYLALNRMIDLPTWLAVVLADEKPEGKKK